MIGGIVVETIELPDRIWINCDDDGDKCAIYVKNCVKARCVSPGDSVWWQDRQALWTARDSRGKIIGKTDTKLERIGYSGAKRPTECNSTPKPPTS